MPGPTRTRSSCTRSAASGSTRRRSRPASSAADLIDDAFLSYNAGRLREGCQLFVRKMLADNGTVGLSLSGALTPAGLGMSCLVPLVEAGFIDWIVCTGANLYHDTHFALGMDLHQAGPNLPDLELRENQVIRIYDIVFDYENLLGTDRFYRTLCRGEAFQQTMGTAEFHYLVGKYLAEREEQTGRVGQEPARGALPLRRADLHDVARRQLDRHEPGRAHARRLEAAHRPAARRESDRGDRLGREGERRDESVFILGGGSPKNFMLQTEPQIQEVLGLAEADTTTSCSSPTPGPTPAASAGATPSEAMTWGKVDPDKLPDSVTCYVDSTIALPLLTAYSLSRTPKRPLKRVFDRFPELTRRLETGYAQTRAKRAE